MPAKLKPVSASVSEHKEHEETLAYRLLRMVSRKEVRATKSDQGEEIAGAVGTSIQASTLPATVRELPWIAVL
jgi:hypothetical protein